MKLWAGAFAIVALNALAQTAPLPSFPSKPIRWIVPFPPGGPADVVARITANKLAERVGQPAIIDNRGGAGGNVGHEVAARSAPDGYTVLFVVPSILTNQFQFKAAIDPFKELAPVIYLDASSLVLVASNSFGAKTMNDIVQRIRDQPGKVTCGSSGALPTVSCAILKTFAKADVTLIQYKGNAAAMTAVMSGEIDLLFDVVTTAVGSVRSGKVRGIGLTNPTFSLSILRELPNLRETIPEFDLAAWQGVMVPRGTPRELIVKHNTELNAVLQDPELRKRFADAGLEPTGGAPEVFEALLSRESVRLGRILRAAGMKPE